MVAAKLQPTGTGALWAPDRRAATVGLLLLVTLAAFEALSVGTAMPTLVAALGGQSLYSWPFTAFLAASVVGTVASGRLCDSGGPRLPLVGGPALFGLGLVIAGLAPTMEVLLFGRLLQGFGAGTAIVALYVVIALAYPKRDHPVVFGAISAAWVVPALIGPAIAGLLTEHASWRWVFLGLVPFVLLAVALLVPLLRRFAGQPERPGRTEHLAGHTGGRRGVLTAAVAAAVGLSALTWAAQYPEARTAVLAVAGLAVLVPALRRLLPAGTVTAARGLPTVVLARGLLAGAFFAVEAYLPLTLTAVHGSSPAMAGLPLTLGAIGWAAASAWQGRFPDYPRDRLLRNGFLLLAVGLATSTAVAFRATPYWLVLPTWAIAAAGMGLAFPSINVRLLELSPPADRGFNSAALQIWDHLLAAACIGVGGVLLVAVASTAAPTPAVTILNLLMAGVALLGAALASRTRAPAPASGP